MKRDNSPYSGIVRQSSGDAHGFMRKLGCKRRDRIRFLLVHDAKRNRAGSGSSSSSRRRAIQLRKTLGRIERRTPQIRLVGSRNEPVHLLGRNAQGYAVFMEINARGGEGDAVRSIRAQFIDVDLNKVTAQLADRSEAKRKIRAIRATPRERIASVDVRRTQDGRYRLVAHRTERRVKQLKRAFLKKHRERIKDAMIVETSNGYHIYWVVKGAAVDRFVPIQKALARKFGSDPMITNLTRVMRMPGFYHMKNPRKPYLVRVVQWGRKKPFTQDELIRKFGLKP